MSISPGRVHDKDTWVLADGLGKRLGSLLDNDVSPASLAGKGSIEGRSVFWVFTVLEHRDDNIFPEPRFTLEGD